MARSATLPPSGPPPALLLSLRRTPRHVYAEPMKIAPATDPELPLSVEFVGLSEDQQKKALAGWPGAKRFSLATTPASQAG